MVRLLPLVPNLGVGPLRYGVYMDSVHWNARRPMILHGLIPRSCKSRYIVLAVLGRTRKHWLIKPVTPSHTLCACVVITWRRGRIRPTFTYLIIWDDSRRSNGPYIDMTLFICRTFLLHTPTCSGIGWSLCRANLLPSKLPHGARLAIVLITPITLYCRKL